MVILVDYNNVLVKHREKGLNSLVDMVISLIDFSILRKTRRAGVRLYGGWYRGNTLTRPAQGLASLILAEYPRPFIAQNGSEKHILTINVELAYSLAIDPTKHFWHTYRPRGFPPGLICEHPSSMGCHNEDCPLLVVYDFVTNERCPRKGCNVTPDDILYKAEQKLVDSMLTVDLIYYATNTSQSLCIVTSDDDLWPGIMSAVINGATVTHIHTRKRRNTPKFYSEGIGQKYIEKNL